MPEYTRIVVIHDKSNHIFSVIKERFGKQPVTLWFSQKENGTENPLPYKHMKEMMKSITKELKDMNKKTDPATILRYVFQLYRIGDTTKHSISENIYSQIPAPGIFDNTWDAWKNLTHMEKQHILLQLENFFTEVDSWWFKESLRESEIQRASHTKTTASPTESIKPPTESINEKLLIKAAKLASVGIISAALFKKLFDLYQNRTSNKKKTSKRRVSIKPQSKKRVIDHKLSKYKYHKKQKHL